MYGLIGSMSASSGAPASSRTASASVPSLFARALRQPLRIAQGAFDRLPDPTQTHARAAATEGIAALRSLADGASDATERAIDRIGILLSRQSEGDSRRD